MNQKICIEVVLFIAVCLCLTSAIPTYGGLSYGFGGLTGAQRYPRSFGGFGVNPYAGAYGGIGSVDPIYSNGFGSEYGSRYGSYGSYGNPYYNRFGGGGVGGGGIGGGIGGIGGGFGGLGNGYGGGGFQY